MFTVKIASPDQPTETYEDVSEEAMRKLHAGLGEGDTFEATVPGSKDRIVIGPQK